MKKIQPVQLFERLKAVQRWFTPQEVGEYFETIGELPLIYNNKKVGYYNVPCSFDIETSSFMDNFDDEKLQMELDQGNEYFQEIYQFIEGSHLKKMNFMTASQIKAYSKIFTIDSRGIGLDVLGDEINAMFPGIIKSDVPEDIWESIIYIIEKGKPKKYPLHKVAVMYEWTLNISGLTMIGRTWDEFMMVYEYMVKKYKIDPEHKLLIYVHNLSYEFQFIRKRLQWESVFADAPREVIKAETKEGIEFRCSLRLSGYSLEKVGEHLQTYKVEKLVGALDYSKLRLPCTDLTDQEIQYCINDCLVVVSYIMEEMLQHQKMIIRIPLTATGFVRRYCRKKCMHSGEHTPEGYKKYKRYRALMSSLTLTYEEYEQLKRGYAGGFTHGSCWYSGQEVEDADSYDFVSSYPASLLSELYPMSKAEIIKIENRQQFYEQLKYYCCLFDVHFVNLQATSDYEHVLSESKCYGMRQYQSDNGRIVYADSVYTTLTDVDFEYIKEFYTWDKIEIGTFRRYHRGYLPKELIEAILKLYNDKTSLKDLEEFIIEYMKSKGMLNSIYGMMVTDICRPEVIYEYDQWVIDPTNGEEQIKKYNEQSSRFLFYPWGVWCTAYSRRNLILYGIKPCGADYAYSDTDSIKIKNAKDHEADILKYNELVTMKLKLMCEHYGIDFSQTRPKTIKGIEKPLGIWEHEKDHYKRFKTLGAKRYLVEKDTGEISLTVSGLNKKYAVPYLIERAKKKTHSDDQNVINDWIFKNFTDELYIPAAHTGKNLHTYIDEELTGHITDYQGHYDEYNELSCIHLSQADFTLSLPETYVNYIMGVQNER